ncbi:MAG: DUF2089 domain-containing protein [Sphaerobacteraceae bacterium]|nr:MAG: DUF2089 domain-containing protein [Sphaerobacteraceae bacterium]
MAQAPGQCPTCQEQLGIRELGCSSCGTTVRGTWDSAPFQRLSTDQHSFLILFVRSRGNLSEIERALGVSYPTVRAKLEELISAMADESPAPAQTSEPMSRRDILDRVARGEISANDALERLKQLPGTD